MPRNVVFDVYRYQILPINREFQEDYLSKYKTPKDLLSHKNEIFEENLVSLKNLNSEKVLVNHKLEVQHDSFFLFRLNVNRNLEIETKDFQHKKDHTWPSFIVAVWNQPDRQLIAVEKRFAAFQHTNTVVRLIVGQLNRLLKHVNLKIFWEPLFEEQVFWSIIEQYKKNVREVRFELVTPNMANISGSVSDELKVLAKTTNSQKTELRLKSDDDAALSLSPANKDLSGLVEYSAKGGGDISIRIKGLKKRIQTSKAIKTIEIDSFEASDPVIAAQVLKNMLNL